MAVVMAAVLEVATAGMAVDMVADTAAVLEAVVTGASPAIPG